MQTGQGKLDQPGEVSRWLELHRSYHGWVELTIHAGENQARVHIPMAQHRNAAEFASLLAETGELVLVSDHPMHRGKL